MTKYNFDRKTLQYSLEQCKKKLKSRSLPLVEKFAYEEDETFFSNMLSGNYSNITDEFYYYEGIEDDIEDNEYSFEELKEILIGKSIELSKILGDNIIDLIIQLQEEEVFYIPSETEEKTLTMDEQVEYTIKNYEQNSKKLLIPARRLLQEKKLIQATTKDEISSYTQFPYSVDLPFIIVNPNERTCILNHELEHALEYILNIDREKKGLYLELGSIYFEMLFCDQLHKLSEDKYSSDYQKRVYETYLYILQFYPLFKFIKELKSRNFQISDKIFKQLCKNVLGVEENELEDYVIYIFEDDNIITQLCYLLSHLKAIELREQNGRKKQDSLDIILPEIIKPVSADQKSNKEKILTYRRYLSEIERKR